MFVPDLAGVRGRKVRKKSTVDMEEYVKNPEYFYKLHKFVTITADVFFKFVHDDISKEAKVRDS